MLEMLLLNEVELLFRVRELPSRWAGNENNMQQVTTINQGNTLAIISESLLFF